MIRIPRKFIARILLNSFRRQTISDRATVRYGTGNSQLIRSFTGRVIQENFTTELPRYEAEEFLTWAEGVGTDAFLYERPEDFKHNDNNPSNPRLQTARFISAPQQTGMIDPAGNYTPVSCRVEYVEQRTRIGQFAAGFTNTDANDFAITGATNNVALLNSTGNGRVSVDFNNGRREWDFLNTADNETIGLPNSIAKGILMFEAELPSAQSSIANTSDLSLLLDLSQTASTANANLRRGSIYYNRTNRSVVVYPENNTYPSSLVVPITATPSQRARIGVYFTPTAMSVAIRPSIQESTGILTVDYTGDFNAVINPIIGFGKYNNPTQAVSEVDVLRGVSLSKVLLWTADTIHPSNLTTAIGSTDNYYGLVS